MTTSNVSNGSKIGQRKTIDSNNTLHGSYMYMKSSYNIIELSYEGHYTYSVTAYYAYTSPLNNYCSRPCSNYFLCQYGAVGSEFATVGSDQSKRECQNITYEDVNSSHTAQTCLVWFIPLLL